MKSVLISTRPKWCEKICHEIGKDEMDKPIYEKRIEVRKSAPKEVPFKAYVYVTKDKPYLYGDMPIKEFYLDNGGYKGGECNGIKLCNGKVIGEFICDRIDEYAYDYCDGVDIDDDTILETAIEREDINIYAKGKTLYGWRIADLKIYDKPKELSEFKTPPCEKSEKACGDCKWLVKINTPDVYECECYVEDGRPITRPPQSWCYVESLGE